MQKSTWHISSLATLNEAERQTWIESLTTEQAAALPYDWPFWAREKQLPPPGDWFCWLLRSGRGFGKTRTGAQWIIDGALNGPYFPIALIGQTKADVRDTMIELHESSILKISPPWFRPKYEPSKRRLVWPNGMVGIGYSGDEPDQLRGPQHGRAWIDELAKFKYPQETWDNMEFGLRLGDDPQVCVTTTPRPIALIKSILQDPATVDVQGSSYENAVNLSPRYIQRVIKRYEGTRLGRQEIHGILLDDVPGALWTHDAIETHRRTKHPDLVRIVVAIDPAASVSESSSETGIVVAGLGADKHGYVLEDMTLSDTPSAWASQAVSGYYKYQADRILGEVNNGGDMVESTVRTVDDNVSFKKISASRGKRTRAEPVAALYEQGKVHHIGMFAELEDQMCQWVPGDESPDRMDALVWAITELMVHETDEMTVGEAPDILRDLRRGY